MFVVSAPKPLSSALPPDAVVSSGHTDMPHTSMRRTIAKRLAESKATVPHTYASTNCVMDNLLKLRKGLEVKVSVNDFIIKAAALTLRQVPEMNAVWGGQEAQLLKEVDISVAVATDTGLITPIVKTADNLPLAEISSTLKVRFTLLRVGHLKSYHQDKRSNDFLREVSLASFSHQRAAENESRSRGIKLVYLPSSN